MKGGYVPQLYCKCCKIQKGMDVNGKAACLVGCNISHYRPSLCLLACLEENRWARCCKQRELRWEIATCAVL